MSECQEIKKALENGALDVLAPATSTQKDVIEFRERVRRWIEDFDQRIGSTGNCSLIFAGWPNNRIGSDYDQ